MGWKTCLDIGSRALLLSCVISSGCGRSEPEAVPAPPAETAQTTTPAAVSESPGTGSATTDGSAQRARDEVWVDQNGNKYLGNIPYDVFAVHPYEISADLAAAATATAVPQPEMTTEPAQSTTALPAVTEVAAESPDPDSATGSDSWDQLISRDVLESEIKDIRNFLTPVLQSVGNFRSSMLMIPPKAATLAALAEIARQHPEKVSWHEDAAYLSNLASKMNESTLQPGAKDQRRLRDLFASITDTLNRSRPAGLEEPPSGQTFSDVAEMRLIMMRMSDAERKLKTEVGSEDSLKEKGSMIQHESELLRTLTKVVTTEGYGYADDPEFKAYAQRIIDAADRVQAAAAVSSLTEYELALTEISTTCQACHSDYKNN